MVLLELPAQWKEALLFLSGNFWPYQRYEKQFFADTFLSAEASRLKFGEWFANDKSRCPAIFYFLMALS